MEISENFCKKNKLNDSCKFFLLETMQKEMVKKLKNNKKINENSYFEDENYFLNRKDFINNKEENENENFTTKTQTSSQNEDFKNINFLNEKNLQDKIYLKNIEKEEKGLKFYNKERI